ncbi:MAG: hypothetical protein ACTSUC_01690 [Promethearchaeota archaeon]
MMKEEKNKKQPKIKIIDGIPCIELETDITSEEKPDQKNSANHQFTYGWMQEIKERRFIPEVLREIEKIFNIPIMPVKWRIFEITKDNEIRELKDEEEKNDNRK